MNLFFPNFPGIHLHHDNGSRLSGSINSYLESQGISFHGNFFMSFIENQWRCWGILVLDKQKELPSSRLNGWGSSGLDTAWNTSLGFPSFRKSYLSPFGREARFLGRTYMGIQRLERYFGISQSKGLCFNGVLWYFGISGVVEIIWGKPEGPFYLLNL